MIRITTLLVALLALPTFAATKFVGALNFDPVTEAEASWPDYGFLKESIALQPTENIPGDSIIVATNVGLDVGDKIVFTVTNGATFANTDYALEESRGGAGTGDLQYAVLQNPPVNGNSSITFVMQESSNPTTLAESGLFILSGSTSAGQAVNFNLPGVAGTDIYLRADIYTSGDVLRESTGNYLMFESSLESASASPLQW